jgi:hypothetical protein
MPAHRTPTHRQRPRHTRHPNDLSDIGVRQDGTLVKIPRHRRRRPKHPWLILLGTIIAVMIGLQLALTIKAYTISDSVDKGMAAIEQQVAQTQQDILGQLGLSGAGMANISHQMAAIDSLVAINPKLPAQEVQYLDHLPISPAQRSAASDYLVAHPHIDSAHITPAQYLQAWDTARLDYNARHHLPLETPLP